MGPWGKGDLSRSRRMSARMDEPVPTGPRLIYNLTLMPSAAMAFLRSGMAISP